MTPAQLTALKADIQGNGTLAALMAAGEIGQVVAYYNAPADPAFYVWRSSVPPDEYRQAIVWTEVDTMTAGKARIWEWVTARMTMPVNASDANVRQGINDAFGNSTSKTQLLAISYRACNNVEKLFATGTGTTGSPATVGYEGTISQADVEYAMAS